jgi:hypothetical protein
MMLILDHASPLRELTPEPIDLGLITPDCRGSKRRSRSAGRGATWDTPHARHISMLGFSLAAPKTITAVFVEPRVPGIEATPDHLPGAPKAVL